MLNMFRALLYPSSGARLLYVFYYRLWCAVLGWWLSGVKCRAAGYASRRGILHDELYVFKTLIFKLGHLASLSYLSSWLHNFCKTLRINRCTVHNYPIPRKEIVRKSGVCYLFRLPHVTRSMVFVCVVELAQFSLVHFWQ